MELFLLPSSDESDKSVYVFPLVTTPKNYTSNFCLRAFANNNREWIGQKILQYDAVLFRGFDIESAQEVEEDVKALETHLKPEQPVSLAVRIRTVSLPCTKDPILITHLLPFSKEAKIRLHAGEQRNLQSFSSTVLRLQYPPIW